MTYSKQARAVTLTQPDPALLIRPVQVVIAVSHVNQCVYIVFFHSISISVIRLLSRPDRAPGVRPGHTTRTHDHAEPAIATHRKHTITRNDHATNTAHDQTSTSTVTRDTQPGTGNTSTGSTYTHASVYTQRMHTRQKAKHLDKKSEKQAPWG